MIAPRITMRLAFENLYPKNRLSPRTVREFRHCLNRWERHTENPLIRKITPDTFDAFRASLASHKAITVERTVDRMLAILRRAHRNGLLVSVPDPGDRLRIESPVPQVPPLEAMSAVYRFCDVARWPNYSQRVRGDTGRSRGGWMRWHAHDWTPQFWRVFLVTAFFTGLRLGDLRQLRRRDFNRDVLMVVAQKTGKHQSIPVHPVLRRHIDSVTWAKPDGLLFPIRAALHQFRRELHAICKAAGVEPVTPQRVRVLSANVWEEAWPTAGAAVLGHSIAKGASRFYLRPSLPLESALPRLKVPQAFMTDDEREHGQDRLRELQRLFERMPTDSQDLLLGMARRIG